MEECLPHPCRLLLPQQKREVASEIANLAISLLVRKARSSLRLRYAAARDCQVAKGPSPAGQRASKGPCQTTKPLRANGQTITPCIICDATGLACTVRPSMKITKVETFLL